MSPFTYNYPRPMVTVDALVFRFLPGEALASPQILLVRRKNPPFAGVLALPGGFVDMEEDLPDAVCRELQEETGLAHVCLELLGIYGIPGRDPRGRTISAAYVGILDDLQFVPRGGDDAAVALWCCADAAVDLAFDHAEIVSDGLRWLRGRSTPRS